MPHRLGILLPEGIPLQVLPDDPPDILVVEGCELTEVLKPYPGQGRNAPAQGTERLPEATNASTGALP